MAKLVVPKENLPDFNAYTGSIDFRFRIITDDKNVSSYWSPLYSINPTSEETARPDVGPTSFNTTGGIILENRPEYVYAAWNPVRIQNDTGNVSLLQNYDIWIRWQTDYSTNIWRYYERSSATSISLIPPPSILVYSFLSIEIYRPAKPIIRKNMSDVYQDPVFVDISSDTISFSSQHNFITGELVKYNSLNPMGGLTNNQSYYVREVSVYGITLHPTKLDAESNTNKINITSNNNSVGFFTSENCPACDLLLYSSYNHSLF